MANITTIKKGNETMQLGISEDRVNQLIDDKISAMPTGGGGGTSGTDSKLYDVTINTIFTRIKIAYIRCNYWYFRFRCRPCINMERRL